MDYGMRNRMSRIFKPGDDRTVMLAVDHGYFQGPTTGLVRPAETIAPLAPLADTLMLTRGVLRNCVDPGLDVPVVLRVSGGTSVLKDDLSDEEITVSMRDAVRLNAAGVAMSVFVGSPHERRTIKGLADLVDEANEFGVPVLAVTAVGKDMVRDARYLGLACRIAAEMGASIVKTYHCQGFESVVAGCPAPVVIAGGKKLEEKAALELTFNAIRDGARGVDMGRNIFQSDCPVGMLKAVRAIVHDGASVAQGYEVYLSEKSKKAR
ncbi:MAG: 3-hydroxy-5-phosphonooxypentane-2,4-dione thiolase [Deltaproteobacteria bacterium]|nr:3-hydroxy-5-phosphonooxypentane-2,4-dione thiolase [Deltaproteobacteria bacterium]